MKLIKFSILFLSMIYQFAYSQTSQFKCNEGRYKDEHSQNEEWNKLIDNACDKINKGKYQEGLSILGDIIYQDSIASGGVANQYFVQQYTKLKNFIEGGWQGEQNSNTNIESVSSPDPKEIELPLPEYQTEQKSGNAETAPELKENKNEALEISTKQEPVVEVPNIEVSEKKATESIPPIEQNITEASPKKTPEPDAIKIFTEEEMAEFHNRGQSKIKMLETFIQQIGSKTTASYIASEAIENAVRLFDSEDRTVEVSSLNRPEKSSFKIRTYFNRLKMLSYDEVDITWADFNYASQFVRARDNTYRAYITFVQRFTGVKDGQVVYTDVTEKRQEVILKSYKKTIEGEENEIWDVLLGDMSVEHTQP